MQAKLQTTNEPQLRVEAQFGDDVTSPEGCDLERLASQIFSLCLKTGYADSFLARAGDVAEIPLCIRLVNETEGQALNQEWRDKPSATNVLSFTADIVAGAFAPLGDLVLCTAVVEREALEQDKALLNHYTHLLVHGMLHLLGYDHIVDTEADAMEAMEVLVLNELGVENPYE